MTKLTDSQFASHDAPHYVSSARSPLACWPGGKFYLAKKIVARMPDHKCYCELFAGAAWPLFKKSPSKVECLNDINSDLIQFYETVRGRGPELMERCAFTFHSRYLHEKYLREPLPEWEEDAVERAFRMLYLIRSSFRGLSSFCGKGQSRTFKSASNTGGGYKGQVLREQIGFAYERLKFVILECLPWQRCLEIYDRPWTFFYLDPPYPESSINYNVQFGWEDCAALARRLASCKAKFLLSISDRPESREIFRGFNMESIETRYSVGAHKRINELLISNYDYGRSQVSGERQGSFLE